MGKGAKKVLDKTANIALQFYTTGLVGMKDGKLTKGTLTKWADEGLGEITGRNVARKAANQQEQAIADEKSARLLQDANEQKQKAGLDRQASNTAQSIRSTQQTMSTAQSTQNTIARTGRLGGDEQNFLGL